MFWILCPANHLVTPHSFLWPLPGWGTTGLDHDMHPNFAVIMSPFMMTAIVSFDVMVQSQWVCPEVSHQTSDRRINAVHTASSCFITFLASYTSCDVHLATTAEYPFFDRLYQWNIFNLDKNRGVKTLSHANNPSVFSHWKVCLHNMKW